MSLIQIDSTQIQDGAVIGDHLSSDAKSSVLASKNLVYLKASVDLTDPDAATVTIQSFPETSEFPFSTTAGVIGDGSAAGVPVLLETAAGNSGQSHGFNTNSNKVWGGQKPFYAADVYDLNGQPLTDPNNGGNKVWAVITASARTTGGTYKIRFYSDEWPAAAGEIVLSNPVTVSAGYFLAYPVIAALGDVPLGALRSDTVPLSKTATGIGAGGIGTSELADGAVTTAKLADGAVTAAKIAAGTITASELADNAVGSSEIADGAVGTPELASGAVSEVKIANAVIGRDLDFLSVDSTYGGVVLASDTSSEGKVAALASPGMAVRVQTGGSGFGNDGRKVTIPTSTSLAISAADATNPRYDAVVCNASGALAVREGTPAGSPSLPTLTSGDVFLAAVKVSANVTEITSSDIFDHRRGVGVRRASKVWTGSTATAYEMPRRLRGTADVFRNGVNLIEAGSPATADEYAVTNPVESNGSVITLGAAPSSSTVRIAGIV